MKTQDEFPGSISLPFGIKTSHTWHEIGAILRIINDYDVTSFAELGCHVGGLGTMLSGRETWAKFKYTGLEINAAYVDKQVTEKLNVSITDIFQNAVEVYSQCKDGVTFIYCDNGDKVREMRVYSALMQSGDIIACHDYYGGQAVYGLDDFGLNDSCGCVPEVRKGDVDFLFRDPAFDVLPTYLLDGTRIIGFVKK